MKFSITNPYTNYPVAVYVSDRDNLLDHVTHMKKLEDRCIATVQSEAVAKFGSNDCRIVMYNQPASNIYTYYRSIMMIFFLKRIAPPF